MMNLRFDVEVRMRLFVLLLGGFLVVAQLGMISLFKQTQTAFINEFDKRLSFTGYTVKSEIESILRERDLLPEDLVSLHKHFKALSLASQFTRIFLLDEKGQILIDSHDPETSHKKIFAKDEGLHGYNLTEPLTLPLGETRTHFLPFPSPLSSERGIWVVGVSSDASFLSFLERRSRFNLFLQIGGIFFVVILLFLFLSSLLKPFLRMQKTALGIGEMGRGEEETAFVERTFQNVIEELRKKEEVLKVLYEKEQKRAQSLEDFNRYILSSVSSGIISVDQEGKITCFNQAASRILGMDGEKIMGRSFREVLGESELSRILEEAVLERKICSRRDVLLPGSKGWVGITSSLLKDTSEALLGATLLFTDITRIKLLEEEVRLKESLASLGEMSAGIAHEFKNSLGTITGYAHLLKKRVQEKGRDGKEGEVVEKILQESLALNHVVNQFLDFARPPQLHLEEVDLNQVLRACSSILSQEKGKWSLNLFLEEGLPRIIGDKGLLQRAFQNLIQNAKDAMPKGGTLTLRTQMRSGSDLLEVSFEDTGCGIPEENLKQIFTPFFSTREEGVGLGLTLAHKIITAHQGRIGIESRVEKGTKVTVELPVKST